MKNVSKVMAVVLAVLMLSTCAFAVEFAADIETRTPPKLVVMTNEDGLEISARIHTAADDHVDDVENHEMILTPYSQKDHEETKPETKEALENALAQLSKADTLADLDIDTETLYIKDLFNVDLSNEEHREYLKEDNKITLIFDLKDYEMNELIVLEHTVDDEWLIVPEEDISVDEDGLMSITVNNVAHVVLATKHDGVGFTESVVQKGAPELIGPEEEKENEFALILDENGNIVYRVSKDEITLTSVANAGDASENIKTALQRAYAQIREAKSIADFASDAAVVLAEMASDLTLDDLVVRDLFDITLSEEANAWLSKEGHTITLTFKGGLRSDDVLLVLNNYSENQWKTVPSNRVMIHDNGNVSVTFDSLSPIAFVVESASLSVDNDQTSPQTGMGATASMMTAGIGAVGVAAVGILRKKFHK